MWAASSASCFSLLVLTRTVLTQGIYYNQSGIGSAGPDDDPNGRFANATRTPFLTNNVSFPGFDFSLEPLSTSQQDLYLSSNWTFHFNYSVLEVTNQSRTPGNTQPQLVSDIVYDMAFLDNEPLPNQNNTNWTMCGHFLITPFPSNLTSRFASETGNCSATLGAECLAAYRKAFLASPLNRIGNSSCPDAPFWKDIPECVNQIGQDFAMVSSSLMNWVPEANLSQIPNYNGPYDGLNSTQPFFYQSSWNYNQTLLDAYNDEYARGMRMAVLTFQPSREFLSSGYSGVVNRDVRFVCGTADPNPFFSGAVGFEAPRTLWILCGVVVTLMLGL